MSAGLLAIYSFGGPTNLLPFIYYGLKAMSNRGDRAVAYVHDGRSARRLELDLAREPEGRVEGTAAVGCVHVEDCCREEGGEVRCGFGQGEWEAYVKLAADGSVEARRPPRLWHLAIGAHGFDLAIVATESAAIEVLGGEVRRSLLAGEAVKVSRYGVELSGGGPPGELCGLELVYTARPDSAVDGIEVGEARRRLARALAAKVKAEVDVVVGMPETGIYYAAAVAEALGRPYAHAFVQTARARSALLEELQERTAVIQLKANPIPAAVRGRRVLLVDDSLISGTTVKLAAQVLRGKAGAREVHVAVAAPPLKARCPYGVRMPPEGHMLYAAVPPEAVPDVLEVDSVTHLSPDDLAQMGPICTLCFTGNARPRGRPP